ncbi:MAG TPA: hypothetical protein VFV34_19605 [Blastocatellia bacterium]|nr:hypothetical protein [Blastocatellia bacterium]
MTARQVHAVIAAGLENPSLLADWRQKPDQLRGYGIEPDDLDLNALWKFAGLAAKVRHNGLRADLPLTFRLMNVAGLEIEMFASYASFRAAEPYADTAQARAGDLLKFLERWLDGDRLEHALLWDLIRYELALAQLSRSTVTDCRSSRRQSTPKPRPASVPRVRGEIVLHEMRCDPRAVGAILQEKSPKLERISLGAFYFCYWRRSSAPEVFVLQLDELGFYLLSLIDGRQSIADLSCMLGGNGKPAPTLLDALAELSAIGILSFDGRSKRTS